MGINLREIVVTILQEDAQLIPGQCYRGVLSRTDDDHYLFEEAVNGKRNGKRNPKLFDGKYVSLVHMANGRYQVHMRTIDASSSLDRRDLAFQVYSELLSAFEIID